MLVAAALALSIGPPPTLLAVGDVMLARYVGRKIESKGVDYPFSGVRHVLVDCDISVGNLECCLTTSLESAPKRIVLKANPRFAAAVPLKLVNLANNHTLDAGAGGLKDTVAALSSRKISFTGLSSGDGHIATVLRARGRRFAFLGYSCFRGPVGVAYYDRSRAKTDIAQAHEAADFVIVMMHWGTEGTPVPDSAQRKIARELASAGATVVLGSHPHVLQPIVRIDGCLVAYSLGNFVFDAAKAAERRTGLLRMEFGEKGVTSWKVIPAQIVAGQPRTR